MPSYPPQGGQQLDPFHDRHSPNSAAHQQQALSNSQSSHQGHSPYNPQQPAYQLSDQYTGSMQSLPNASQYSLAGRGGGDAGEGEKYFGDEGYNNQLGDSDKTPLRSDFNHTQPTLAYDQDQPL